MIEHIVDLFQLLSVERNHKIARLVFGCGYEQWQLFPCNSYFSLTCCDNCIPVYRGISEYFSKTIIQQVDRFEDVLVKVWVGISTEVLDIADKRTS